MGDLSDNYRRHFALTNFNESGQGYTELKDNQHLEANRDRRGTVTGILINLGPAQATVAIIDGILWDDTENVRSLFYLSMYNAHPIRFKRIYASGTTATSVTILGL